MSSDTSRSTAHNISVAFAGNLPQSTSLPSALVSMAERYFVMVPPQRGSTSTCTGLKPHMIRMLLALSKTERRTPLKPQVGSKTSTSTPCGMPTRTTTFFSLSMDHLRGRDLYKFNMSLMECLSSSGPVMSRIDAHIDFLSGIRSTLILKTMSLSATIPLFFVNHSHRENEGSEDSASKYNLYEARVQMICELVLYLLRQGCYPEEGDIMVLCTYLVIVIDEHDQAALADQEGDDTNDLSCGITIEHVQVMRRVRLCTIDNYQGEEGRIVILLLVQNSGKLDNKMASLGFMHAARPDIGFLKVRALGPAPPITCHWHPETFEYV
ncbi:uncharacterized protein F5891DRAFT_1252508 [Suillus fuscotomentosus]|uniref:DNA2/NAM7 helicase-like C-terminal domain-containing protein n=1 Tax=Suillus fuscotomentosus TaxID=1912939 RepID=A0AAD4HF03_9AGAM|nr:uncharacterized protein F5891DRAFT_1252508 [Suillus fuscotomentosus]KAG1895200.1 hypothetical protein F5891DRAFT_1252508 [Suillus fuscotomentosus]